MTAKLSKFERMRKVLEEQESFGQELPSTGIVNAVDIKLDASDPEVEPVIVLSQIYDGTIQLDQEQGAALARILTKIFL